VRLFFHRDLKEGVSGSNHVSKGWPYHFMGTQIGKKVVTTVNNWASVKSYLLLQSHYIEIPIPAEIEKNMSSFDRLQTPYFDCNDFKMYHLGFSF
jgi:hypothetical protein